LGVGLLASLVDPRELGKFLGQKVCVKGDNNLNRILADNVEVSHGLAESMTSQARRLG
jgi:hypothetical protein